MSNSKKHVITAVGKIKRHSALNPNVNFYEQNESYTSNLLNVNSGANQSDLMNSGDHLNVSKRRDSDFENSYSKSENGSNSSMNSLNKDSFHHSKKRKKKNLSPFDHKRMHELIVGSKEKNQKFIENNIFEKNYDVILNHFNDIRVLEPISFFNSIWNNKRHKEYNDKKNKKALKASYSVSSLTN